jgi:hypothetical protein
MKFSHILLALTFCTGVQAQLYTGNDVYDGVKDNANSFDRASMTGYISGVVDSHAGSKFCPPSGVTVGQMRDMVKRQLEANPQSRHHLGAAHVAIALQDAWPCPRKQPQ